MYVIEKSIWIDRLPKEVFDFHVAHANRAKWHEHVSRSEMVTPPPVGLGSRFKIDATSAGRPTPMTIEITAYDRPKAYTYRATAAYRTKAASAITNSHQTFVAENGGTHFQVRAELHFKGLAKPFGWFILKFGLERHIEAAVKELKEEMEGV